MGCWNETCGITQMPIEGGDKVRMFLIVENEWAGEDVAHSYNTDLWKPFGLPLKGTYDEYGRIENIEEDELTDLMLSALKEIIVEVPNRMGDSFKREDLTWEIVIDFLTDEGLRVTKPDHMSFINKKLDELLKKMKEKHPNLPDNGWSSQRSKLADQQKAVVEEDKHIVRMYHMMVHEDVYQALITYKVPAVRFSSWTDGNLRAELEAGAVEYITSIRNSFAKQEDLSNENKFAFDLRRISRMQNNSNRFVSATNHLNGSSCSGQYLIKYLDFLEDRIKNGVPDDDMVIKNLTNKFIDFVCFNQAMCLLRKMWIPQCGKGGQDREYVIYKYLGEVISSFSEKKIKQWDEEYDDQEDE